MDSDTPSDIVFAFSAYSVVLWLVVLGLLGLLYVFARPIRAMVPSTARNVCARSAFFLAAFNLSPVMASVLGLTMGVVPLFVFGFLALGIVLRRSAAFWPVVVFAALVVVQVVLDLSFFVAAPDYATASGSLVDFLLFREPTAEGAVHIFLMLPVDVALLFHMAKTALGLGTLYPAFVALREGRTG